MSSVSLEVINEPYMDWNIAVKICLRQRLSDTSRVMLNAHLVSHLCLGVPMLLCLTPGLLMQTQATVPKLPALEAYMVYV